jgi:hypothetical protein
MYRQSRLTIQRLAITLLACAALTVTALPSQADTFNLSTVTIDTHALSGSTGYLLFSYGPDTTGSTPINSAVTVSSPSLTTFSVANTGASNYDLEPFTFGSTFTFTPTFNTTSTPGANEGNLFTLYALDGSYNPYPSTDPTGSNAAAMIVQYADGHVSTPSVYTPFAPVPEASTAVTFGILALGTAFALFLRRRQNA